MLIYIWQTMLAITHVLFAANWNRDTNYLIKKNSSEAINR